MKKELQLFVRDYLKAIYDNNAAIFAVAGLYIPAGFVNWKGLLREVAYEPGLLVKPTGNGNFQYQGVGVFAGKLGKGDETLTIV